MAVTIPAFQDILNGVIASIAANTVITQNGVTVTPDFNIGSFNLTFAEVLALALDLVYVQVENVYNGSFVATATGSDLDNLAQLIGVSRLPPQAAQAQATFTTNVTTTIPAGTVVLAYDTTGLPSIRFATNSDLTITSPTTTGTVGVTAAVPGSASTIAGTTTALMQSLIAGVTAVSLGPSTPAVPGTDAETDVNFRARILENTFLNKGTRSNIISTVEGLSGVKAAYPYTDGGGTIYDGNGVFGLLVQPMNGVSFTTPQQTAITNAIASLKSAGITLTPNANGWTTLTPTLAAVSVTVKIRDTSQSATTTAAVGAAISNYLNALPMGAPIIYDEIITVALGVANVYDQTALTVTYASTPYTSNVTVAPNAVAGAGTMTISWSA